MRQALAENWQLTPEQAVRQQRELRRLLSDAAPSRVATVAAAYATFQPDGQVACSAAVALTWPKLEVIETARARTVAPSTYVSGLLAWSLGPALCDCLSLLNGSPDVLFLWGHGRAHPRGLGVAAHLGLLFDVPTIGCADRLISAAVPPVDLPDAAGSWRLLATEPDAEPCCAAVRTRPGTRPLFVSAGHRMNLSTAVELTVQACRGYRAPEPLRVARRLSRELRWAHAAREGC